MYVGIDLHKPSLQVTVVNNNEMITRNMKAENTHQAIKQAFSTILLSFSVIMESPSVWYGIY